MRNLLLSVVLFTIACVPSCAFAQTHPLSEMLQNPASQYSVMFPTVIILDDVNNEIVWMTNRIDGLQVNDIPDKPPAEGGEVLEAIEDVANTVAVEEAIGQPIESVLPDGKLAITPNGQDPHQITVNGIDLDVLVIRFAFLPTGVGDYVGYYIWPTVDGINSNVADSVFGGQAGNPMMFAFSRFVVATTDTLTTTTGELSDQAGTFESRIAALEEPGSDHDHQSILDRLDALEKPNTDSEQKLEGRWVAMPNGRKLLQLKLNDKPWITIEGNAPIVAGDAFSHYIHINGDYHEHNYSHPVQHEYPARCCDDGCSIINH